MRIIEVEQRKLESIENYILSFFNQKNRQRILTKEIFNSTGAFSNADLVRAFEDLEKRWRLLVRYTDEGNDWISLTPEGLRYADVSSYDDSIAPLPHPPKSSTINGRT